MNKDERNVTHQIPGDPFCFSNTFGSRVANLTLETCYHVGRKSKYQRAFHDNKVVFPLPRALSRLLACSTTFNFPALRLRDDANVKLSETEAQSDVNVASVAERENLARGWRNR